MLMNLYAIWNRLSSGSYHPQAVREVEIPKQDGKKRKLGIPTLRDRIAQQVVKDYMEKKIDMIFHENSYGYRPMKGAHQAIEQVRQNCYKQDWVIDMDISKFFGWETRSAKTNTPCKEYSAAWQSRNTFECCSVRQHHFSGF